MGPAYPHTPLGDASVTMATLCPTWRHPDPVPPLPAAKPAAAPTASWLPSCPRHGGRRLPPPGGELTAPALGLPPALLLPPGRHGGLRWPGPAGVPQQHYQGRSAPLPAGGGGAQGAPVWEVLGWRVMGSGVPMQGKVLGVQVWGLVSVGVCISEVRGSGGTDIGCGRD